MRRLIYTLPYIALTLLAQLSYGHPSNTQHNTNEETSIKPQDCVILLHGLARSSHSLRKLEKSLAEEGFKTVNQNYPSTKDPIEKLAEKYVSKAIGACGPSSQIHFVTHSMGGILVRQYLSTHSLNSLGKVVMLGPPNQGSETVDRLGKLPGFKFFNGPAGMQLGTGKGSLPKSLNKADFTLGVIAGTQSINLILSYILPSTDDGKVTLESTKLEGMAGHISLPVTHTFMMLNGEVIKQVIYFIKNGKFKNNLNSSNIPPPT